MSKYTYIGRRINKGKLIYAFRPEDDPTKIIWWETKPSRFSGCTIGTTYEIGESLPISWHDAKVDRVSEDAMMRWQALDRSEYLIHSQKRVDASPQLTEAVRQIQMARSALGANQRTAFDVWLMNQIR